ncbi:hypothetical protein [Vibrio sp. WXL103]|uniref:hypothetical protein n=1 Tax=Vibrio sp. WXL103 TaxID=3450710 RepID=UPI003EC671E9
MRSNVIYFDSGNLIEYVLDEKSKYCGKILTSQQSYEVSGDLRFDKTIEVEYVDC